MRRPEDFKIAASMGAMVEAIHLLDLTSSHSIKHCASDLVRHGGGIDVVLHNAGIIFPSQQRRKTGEGIEENLAVAAVGPMLFSRLVKSVLSRPSRLVGVNSALHAPGTRGTDVSFQFTDPNLDTHYMADRAYKNAKLAQLWFLFEWERRFGPEGLHADAVSPGFVPETAARRATGIQRVMLRYILPRMPFARSVDEGASAAVQACELPLDQAGGRYFEEITLTPASSDARNPVLAARFWELAMKWMHPETDPL
jgi:NAD(P)-dependent dehydrogenase (short-subunit alcohol dehydrogenase family)